MNNIHLSFGAVSVGAIATQMPTVQTPALKDKVLPMIDGQDFVIKLASYDNADALLQFRVVNQEFLTPFEPTRHPSYYTLPMVQSYLTGLENSMSQSRSINWLIWDKSQQYIIGVINFSNIMPAPFNACFLGYSLHQNYQGLGIMTQALSLVIDEMFNKAKLHRIMANYLPDNHRSAKVLERLGFVKEGYAKDYLQINGKWQDHILTALTNHQLPAL